MITTGFSKFSFDLIKTIAVFFVLLKAVAIVIGAEVLKQIFIFLFLKYFLFFKIFIFIFWGCLVLANEEW